MEGSLAKMDYLVLLGRIRARCGLGDARRIRPLAKIPEIARMLHLWGVKVGHGGALAPAAFDL